MEFDKESFLRSNYCSPNNIFKEHEIESIDNNSLLLSSQDQNSGEIFYSPEPINPIPNNEIFILFRNPDINITPEELGLSETEGKKDHLTKKHNFFVTSKNDKKREYFRVEDAKKHFKVGICRYVCSELNDRIKKSQLPNWLKKKIHMPNSKAFTQNCTFKKNIEFLSLTLKDMLILGKNEKNLQKMNEIHLENILNCKYTDKITEIKKFLDLTFEEIISLFYKSSYFDKFKNTDITKFFRYGVLKEKKIDLLEYNGFVQLLKFEHKKTKGIKVPRLIY